MGKGGGGGHLLGGGIASVEELEGLVKPHGDARQSGANSRGAEAVRDKGEVRKMALDRRVEDRLRSTVAERTAVLVEHVNDFLQHRPDNAHH